MNELNDGVLDVTELTGDEIIRFRRFLYCHSGLTVSDLLEFIAEEIAERECANDEQRYDYQSLYLS